MSDDPTLEFDWRYHTTDTTLVWLVPDTIDSLIESRIEATPERVVDVLRARGVQVCVAQGNEGTYHFSREV